MTRNESDGFFPAVAASGQDFLPPGTEHACPGCGAPTGYVRCVPCQRRRDIMWPPRNAGSRNGATECVWTSLVA